jgi:[acyl-carrier-protein] S-malonyltransferase
VGAGKVLTGIAKRIVPDATAVALGAPADLEAFAKSI